MRKLILKDITNLKTDVEISIKDFGIGMSSAIFINIFRLNVQAMRKGKEIKASTGTKLILCKDFIEKQSSIFFVESEIEKGSNLYFQLSGNLQLTF